MPMNVPHRSQSSSRTLEFPHHSHLSLTETSEVRVDDHVLEHSRHAEEQEQAKAGVRRAATSMVALCHEREAVIEREGDEVDHDRRSIQPDVDAKQAETANHLGSAEDERETCGRLRDDPGRASN